MVIESATSSMAAQQAVNVVPPRMKGPEKPQINESKPQVNESKPMETARAAERPPESNESSADKLNEAAVANQALAQNDQAAGKGPSIDIRV